jgi:TonB family protein
MFGRFLVVVALSMMVHMADVKAADAKRVWVTAPVKVSADGRATIGAFAGASGALETAIRADLARRTFVAAKRNAVPVDAEANLTIVVALTPRGEKNYGVEIEKVFVGPLVRLLDPPLYPRNMVRARKTGYAELRVTISAEGRVERIVSAVATEAEFERAARLSLRKARFDPIKLEGQPSASDVSIPFIFRMEQRPIPGYSPVCELDVRQPSVQGQDGCVSQIEAWAVMALTP